MADQQTSELPEPRQEVDGTGRRYSTGNSAGKCLSGRSYTCRCHAQRSSRPQAQRPAAAETEAIGERVY